MKSSSTLKVMLNAAKAKPRAVVGSGKAGIAFGERFVAGEIPAFHCMLEDSAALHDLQSVDPAVHNQLMNITLCYANSLCESMAVALFDQVPGLHLVKVVDPAGVPLHTCVSNKRPGVGGSAGDCLNANGVISSADLIAQWERITGHAGIRIEPTTLSEVIGYGLFDERHCRHALELFGFASQFMDEHLDSLTVKKAPERHHERFEGLSR